MNNKHIFLPVMLATALLAPLAVQAGAGHDKANDSAAGHMNMKMDMGSQGDMPAGHGGHAHEAWLPAPQSYAGKRWAGWNDTSAASRGKDLFEQQCASCHGVSGKGNGPASTGLAHKPADLTNNFHDAPGKGDDYLFWRISEGGSVEPFRSQQSAMPAFKNVLSEADRWDVLTYVHQQFHGGFPEDTGTHEEHGTNHKSASEKGGHHDH